MGHRPEVPIGDALYEAFCRMALDLGRLLRVKGTFWERLAVRNPPVAFANGPDGERYVIRLVRAGFPARSYAQADWLIAAMAALWNHRRWGQFEVVVLRGKRRWWNSPELLSRSEAMDVFAARARVTAVVDEIRKHGAPPSIEGSTEWNTEHEADRPLDGEV